MGRLLRMIFGLVVLAVLGGLGWLLLHDLPATQQRTTLPVTQGVNNAR